MSFLGKKEPEIKTTGFLLAWECECGEVVRSCWPIWSHRPIPTMGVCQVCGRLTESSKRVTGKWTYVDSKPIKYLTFTVAHRY